MKLNYRDKIILGALVAIVILLAGFFTVIRSRKQDIQDNKATLETARQEKAEVEGKIAEIKPLQDDIQSLYKESSELSGDFVEYNDIYNPRKIDQYMQHFAEDCEVKVMSLQTADLSEGTLDYYYFKHELLGKDMLTQADLNGDMQAARDELTAEEDALKDRNQESVLTGKYTIQVKGTKENIWKYMQALEDQKETILIESVTLQDLYISEKLEDVKKALAAAEGKEDEEEATAQIDISLYSVYDLAEPDVSED